MLVGSDTLPPYKPGDFPTLGPAIVIWGLQNGIKVLDGKLAGKPFVPTPSQYTFLAHWYRLREDGEFYYRAGAIRLARGSLKSPLGGFLSTVELVGPVRFAGWDSNDAYGNLLGSRQSMPLIQLAAVSEAQTANTFNYVAGWCGRDTDLRNLYGLDPGKTHVFSPGAPGIAGGKITILTSSAATVRGSRPSLVVADECSEWTESNGGLNFADVILDNATKVDGARVLYLMNTWTPGSGSVAESLYEAWLAEQAGDVVNERPLLYWSREASPDTDWSDPESIAETLEYIYEECPWVNRKQVLSTIMSSSKQITSSMREYGNLIVSNLSSWVSKQDWDACAKITEPMAAGEEISLFCDVSESDDATAIVACRISDGAVFPIWIHEPARSGPLDYGELDRQMILAWKTYKVLAFGSDVHPAEQMVKVTWAERYEDELLIWATKTDPIAWDMRIHKREFAQAAEIAAGAIESGELLHAGDPTLSRHVINTQRRPYQEFISVGKGDRSRKIDASVAMIGARMMRRRLLESPEFEKSRRKSRVIVFR